MPSLRAPLCPWPTEGGEDITEFFSPGATDGNKQSHERRFGSQPCLPAGTQAPTRRSRARALLSSQVRKHAGKAGTGTGGGQRRRGAGAGLPVGPAVLHPDRLEGGSQNGRKRSKDREADFLPQLKSAEGEPAQLSKRARGLSASCLLKTLRTS